MLCLFLCLGWGWGSVGWYEGCMGVGFWMWDGWLGRP